MKAKRVVGVLAALLLCICMIMPVNTDAAAQVRVRTVKGVTSSYTGRMSYCYVNGQKRKLTKYPIFKKSGAYMGPVGAILKNSKLKVKATAKGDKLTLTYGPNTVIVRADSRTAVTNGQKSTMGAPVVHGTYTATGKRRWIVPLNSVCTRLGINYKLSNGKIYISGTTQSSSNNTTGSTTTTTTTTKPSTTSSKDKIKIVIDAGHGEESDPNVVGSLMGWMCERCGEISIGNEWICHDPYVQIDHAQDPFDAFTRPTSNRSIYDFIQLCTKILSDDPLFFLVNSYTTGLAPAVLTYMLSTELKKFGGHVDSQEIGLPVSSNGLVLPCGASGRWEA